MAQTAASNLGTADLTNRKLKYFAAAVLDAMPYIRLSRSYFKDDVKNKKAGMVYRFYVPDPGIAVAGTDELDITNDNKDIWELPVDIKLVEGRTDVALNAWHKLTAIEDFTRDIAEPHGRSLGAEIEKTIIEDNWFRADSSILDNSGNPSTKIFALLAARLRGIRSQGTKVGFAHPDVFAALGDALLGKFLPSEIMKKIFGDTVIAHAFGSEWIEENYMPFITVPNTLPSALSVNWKTGAVTGTNLYDGYAFTCSATANGGKTFKTVDLNGKITNEDFVFIAKGNSTDGFFIQLTGEQIRFAEDGSGKKLSNPTIGAVPGAIDDTTGVMTGITIAGLKDSSGATFTAGATYAVIQVRDRDALEFDTYEFDEVAGAKNGKMKAAEITVQTAEQGSIATRNSIMRIDVPYMSKLVLTKLARVAFVKV